MSSRPVTFGILTVSDTCYAKQKEDAAGPALAKDIKSSFPNSNIILQDIVPDERDFIVEKLIQWSKENCNVILTTGGTGFSPRDVTPEATKSVIEKEVPGMMYAMISRSLAVTELAMLSRAICGIKGRTLIINLPGSTKGATECFGFIKKPLLHAVDLLNDMKKEVEEVHRKAQEVDKCNEIRASKSKVKVNVASRPRCSPFEIYEVEDAIGIIRKVCKPQNDSKNILIEESMEYILAEDIIAHEPYPPFPASIKDGYAVKYEDGAGLRKVRDAAVAGDEPNKLPLTSGEAIRISTGAALPKGANAVVQVENTTLLKVSEDGSKELEINVDTPPTEGLDIRPIGCDIPAGSVVLKKYSRIDAASIGVLATLGKSEVKVFKKPRVGVLSTGNELCGHRDVLKPGQIRDSNKLTLLNLLSQCSYQPVDCRIAKDDPDEVKSALEKAFSKNDIVVTTGGVSMGEFDLVKRVLEEDLSATIHFGRVNMKPGKPTTFATLTFNGKQKMLFGLPGNPVSASVTCLLFVIPTLRHLENDMNCDLPKIKVALKGKEIVNNDIRPEFVRVKLQCTKDGLSAESTGDQISSRLNSVVGANGLLYLPGKSRTEQGVLYDAYVIGRLY